MAVSPTLPEAQAAPHERPSRGRMLLFAGCGVCLLGILLVIVQYMIGWLIVPWYSALLGLLGVVLVAFSIRQRRTAVRFVALIVLMLLAGSQCYFLVSMSRLPDYAGPAAGASMPAFRTAFADGKPFTQENLSAGLPHVLVFYRGRW